MRESREADAKVRKEISLIWSARENVNFGG